MFFKRPDHESVSAGMNKLKHSELMQASRRDGITYSMNGDVTHFTELNVTHSRETEAQADGSKSFNTAATAFQLTQQPQFRALPVHDPARAIMEDMRQLKAPVRVK